MAYDEENYITEYTEAYEIVLAQSMESLSAGKDTPLEKLFTLIDESGDDTTSIEKLSMKKDAYMQLLSTVTAQSQKTAQTLVEKKFKFGTELLLQANSKLQSDKQLEILEQNYSKLIKEVAYLEAQKTALEEQVIDNRRIKSADSMGETYGTAMAGGLTVSQDMWTKYFDMVQELSDAGSVPSNTVISKLT